MAETSNEMMENGTVTEQTQERTFTQAELEDILKSRLAKERAKYTDYETLQKKASKFDEMEEANKSELQKATEKADALQKQIDAMTKEKEIRDIRLKVAKETGVPDSLLTGDTEELCTDQALKILEYKNESKKAFYPDVKDGGEVQINHKKTTQDQFADWFSASLKN